MTQALTTSIRLVQQAIAAEYGDKARKLATTPVQIEVLRALLLHGPMVQRRITELSGVDRSSLSEMLRRLVEQRMAAQVRLESDMRAIMVSITPAGIQALARAERALLSAEDVILRKLPYRERGLLLRLLAKAGA